MLVLSRKEGESLVIGDNITITINRISGNRITVGVDAPREVRIVRGELTVFEDEPGKPDSRGDSVIPIDVNAGQRPRVAIYNKPQE